MHHSAAANPPAESCSSPEPRLPGGSSVTYGFLFLPVHVRHFHSRVSAGSSRAFYLVVQQKKMITSYVCSSYCAWWGLCRSLWWKMFRC